MNEKKKRTFNRKDMDNLERVSDEWLAWEIEYGENPDLIVDCLEELQERREKEKSNTQKGTLERMIKNVFERDFNDFSPRQLGEIAKVIMNCSECPIYCHSGDRCDVVFENALKKEMECNK